MLLQELPVLMAWTASHWKVVIVLPSGLFFFCLDLVRILKFTPSLQVIK